MHFCIHRGTRQIGGSCVEVEADDSRILLDLGLPLDAKNADPALLPPVSGLREPDPTLQAIVVSHGHRDHWGLLPLIHTDVPVLMGKATFDIMIAASYFMRDDWVLSHATMMGDRRPIQVGPFVITPYLVDHSAFDAYALLIEAAGKRLFYSGDLRAHGRKASLFERLVETPPSDIDVMLMEGTSIGRTDGKAIPPSESDIESALVEEFRDTKGAVLLFASAQNIDRMVSVFRACRKSGRNFVLDLYGAEVLRATGNLKIPQSDWPQIDVFLPHRQRIQVKERCQFELLRRHHKNRIYPEQLKERAGRSVFLCRQSMIEDFERANCLSGARAIWSLWEGYLKEATGQELQSTLNAKGIPLKVIHTSGHASVKDLKRLAAAVAPKSLVPIHTFGRDLFPQLFENVMIVDDGEWRGV